MLVKILKLITMIFSPEFEDIIREIRKAKTRSTTRAVEDAKQKAQAEQDTRKLQEELGKLTE